MQVDGRKGYFIHGCLTASSVDLSAQMGSCFAYSRSWIPMFSICQSNPWFLDNPIYQTSQWPSLQLKNVIFSFCDSLQINIISQRFNNFWNLMQIALWYLLQKLLITFPQWSAMAYLFSPIVNECMIRRRVVEEQYRSYQICSQYSKIKVFLEGERGVRLLLWLLFEFTIFSKMRIAWLLKKWFSLCVEIFIQ